MSRFPFIQVENAAGMSEMERLEAAFKFITNTSIQNIQNDLEAAKAMSDEDSKKTYHIQIGMFRHAQSIFAVAKNYATDESWNNG